MISWEPERRLKRWRSTCAPQLRARLGRSVEHRLFLIGGRYPSSGELKESSPDEADLDNEFTVLGHSGNVYTIRLGNPHSCTCPDFMKGNVCKHILFVLHGVLEVSTDDLLLYQAALLRSELFQVFSHVLLDRSAANQTIRFEYAKLAGTEMKLETKEVVRKPVEAGDNCAICYTPMGSVESLVWCQAQCGGNLHSSCFTQWANHACRSGFPVQCPLCRAGWTSSGNEKPQSNSGGHSLHRSSSGSYINLDGVGGFEAEHLLFASSDSVSCFKLAPSLMPFSFGVRSCVLMCQS